MSAAPAEVVDTRRQSPETIVEGFSARLAGSPDAVFIADVDGTGLSYREVQARADALRAALHRHGVRHGDRVGLFFGNALAWPVASLAVWQLGASVVACGTVLSPREAVHAFTTSNVAAVITTAPAGLDGCAAPIILVSGRADLPVSESDNHPPPVVVPHTDAEAVVFFTSGTTGTPKSVPHVHANLVRWAAGVARAYAGKDTFRPTVAPEQLAPGVIFTPFGHIGGYLSLAFRIWIGRSAVLVGKFSPEAVAALLGRHDFDALQLTPTMIHMLAHAPGELPINRLRYVTSSTAPLSEATRAAFQDRYGIPILQAYGMTEVGTISQERYEDVAAGRRPPNSVGRPTATVQIRIVDDDGVEVRDGGIGQIVVASATLAGSASGGDGWFATGDLGQLDADGFLAITGRLSDRIIVGGFNVYPAEVEDVFRRSALVTDAGVVGVDDDRLGQTPVAAVVWAGTPDPDALRAEAREQLAHYKVPRRWVAVEEIPQTARGKVDRIALAREVEKRLAEEGASA